MKHRILLLTLSCLLWTDISCAVRPRLSIIISICKQRNLLAGSLADLTQQTIFSDCELLLIGSREYNCTMDIVPYLQKFENIRFICMKKEPFDEIDLINFAIEQAKAPLLIKVSCGDTHLADAFEKKVIELEKNESIDVAYSDYWWSNEPYKQALQRTWKHVSILPEFNASLFSAALPGPEPMWRKSLHVRFGYFTKEFPIKFEWAFWKKMSSQKVKFKKISKPDMVHFFDKVQAKAPEYIARLIATIDEEQSIVQMYHVDYEKKTVERPIVIIVPSYNNALWCKRNLDSICMQRYENYRIIYINDASLDDTDFLVRNYMQLNNQLKRFTYIKNVERKGCPLANIVSALNNCLPEEIAILLDGDDWFPHGNVLAYINNVYSDPNVWLTYGQFAVFPTQISGWLHKVPPEVIRQNTIRQYDWVTSHLRTFYVRLFKHIQIEDLMFDGQFFPMAGDLALMFPLFELAGNHSRFTPEVLYIYNRANALNEDKVNKGLQSQCEQAARAGHVYMPL